MVVSIDCMSCSDGSYTLYRTQMTSETLNISHCQQRICRQRRPKVYFGSNIFTSVVGLEPHFHRRRNMVFVSHLAVLGPVFTVARLMVPVMRPSRSKLA